MGQRSQAQVTGPTWEVGREMSAPLLALDTSELVPHPQAGTAAKELEVVGAPPAGSAAAEDRAGATCRRRVIGAGGAAGQAKAFSKQRLKLATSSRDAENTAKLLHNQSRTGSLSDPSMSVAA